MKLWMSHVTKYYFMSELHILQVQAIRIFPSQEEGGRVPFVDLLFRMPWGSERLLI